MIDARDWVKGFHAGMTGGEPLLVELHALKMSLNFEPSLKSKY